MSTRVPNDLPRAWRFMRMGDGDWQLRLGYILIGRIAGQWVFTRNVNRG